MRTMPLLFLLAILPGIANAQQNPSPDQDNRSEDVVKRGEHVMGFSHEATTHHFRLFKDGGEIGVTAKDPNDKAGIEQIRTYRQDVFLREFQGAYAHSRHEPARRRDDDQAQGADSLRILGNRTRRAHSACHGQFGDHRRGPRLPALSNR